MQSSPAPTSNARILAAEIIGTTILMLGGPGAAVLAGDRLGVLGVALSFGFTLTALAYVIGPVSGCHVNPAVTLAMWLTRKVSTTALPFYWIGQFLGAALGGLIVFGIANGVDGWDRGSFAANGWAELSSGGYGLGSTIVVELVFTALLVFVFLSVTNRHAFTGMGGLAVGLTYAFVHLVTSSVDNTGVNPARSFGTAIFADNGSYDALLQLWAFVVFPLLGAVVGVFVWLLADDATLEDTALANPALIRARDLADRAVDEVVEEIEEITD
jgi:aquaporin Z